MYAVSEVLISLTLEAETFRTWGQSVSKWQAKVMAQHIEDLRQRYVELKKRIELVRSYL